MSIDLNTALKPEAIPSMRAALPVSSDLVGEFASLIGKAVSVSAAWHNGRNFSPISGELQAVLKAPNNELMLKIYKSGGEIVYVPQSKINYVSFQSLKDQKE